MRHQAETDPGSQEALATSGPPQNRSLRRSCAVAGNTRWNPLLSVTRNGSCCTLGSERARKARLNVRCRFCCSGSAAVLIGSCG